MSESVDQEDSYSLTSRRPRLSSLPVLPAMTAEILQLAEDPHATVNDLNAVISRDPALSCRLLRVVNSSFYGLSRQVASVQRAIVILGINATRNLAIVASMVKLFHVSTSSDSHRSVIDDLWRHSLCTAAATKLIADQLRQERPDELFLAGLIHDIGIIAEIYSERAAFLEILRETAPDDSGIPVRSMCDVEFEQFGDDHQGLGGDLCTIWRFPGFLAEITAHHHRPLALKTEARKAACMISVADHLAGSLAGNFRLDLMSLEVPEAVLDELQLDRAILEVIRERLVQELDDICGMLV